MDDRIPPTSAGQTSTAPKRHGWSATPLVLSILIHGTVGLAALYWFSRHFGSSQVDPPRPVQKVSKASPIHTSVFVIPPPVSATGLEDMSEPASADSMPPIHGSPAPLALSDHWLPIPFDSDGFAFENDQRLFAAIGPRSHVAK